MRAGWTRRAVLVGGAAALAPVAAPAAEVLSEALPHPRAAVYRALRPAVEGLGMTVLEWDDARARLVVGVDAEFGLTPERIILSVVETSPDKSQLQFQMKKVLGISVNDSGRRRELFSSILHRIGQQLADKG